MENIENKLNKIQEDIVEIKETLARNTTSLELHMQRTELAEKRIELLQTQGSNLKDKVNAHINKVKGAAIAISVIGTIIFALWQMGVLAKLF